MISTVIFDLDGVIVSTDKLHYKAWEKLANRESIYFDEIINNRLRGVSRRESLEIILEKSNKTYSEEQIEEMMNYKNDIYKSLLNELNSDDILPNVLVVLNELKKNGIKIAIGSSSKNAKIILKQIGLLDHFDLISDGNNIKRSKPFPDVFEYVSDNLNVDPSSCLVVEDAKSGIDAGKSANMLTVGISDAYSYSKCDYHLKSILELLRIIL